MSRRKKIENIIIILLMLICALAFLADPEDGYIIVIFIMCVSLFLYGTKLLIYYFAMARHMVGGKKILYLGMILFDLGVFVVVLADIPRLYIMFYLLGTLIFSGVIDVLRYKEQFRYNAAHRMKLIQGIINISIGIVGLFFLKSNLVVVYLYVLGMFTSIAGRIYNMRISESGGRIS